MLVRCTPVILVPLESDSQHRNDEKEKARCPSTGAQHGSAHANGGRGDRASSGSALRRVEERDSKRDTGTEETWAPWASGSSSVLSTVSVRSVLSTAWFLGERPLGAQYRGAEDRTQLTTLAREQSWLQGYAALRRARSAPECIAFVLLPLERTASTR
jgi:hypothetical protein